MFDYYLNSPKFVLILYPFKRILRCVNRTKKSRDKSKYLWKYDSHM